MSAKSDALETAVTDYIRARTALDAAPGARARALADRAFARLAALAAPRIRYFTRSYGLSDVAEDAAQVCAIAIHRAAERYDPARARFTTYVNWQIRAELQALRLRLHGDQRCAGRRHVTATLSIDALQAEDGDEWLLDPAAESGPKKARPTISPRFWPTGWSRTGQTVAAQNQAHRARTAPGWTRGLRPRRISFAAI